MRALQIILLLFALSVVVRGVHAQDYQIAFALYGENGTPDSVLVENQTQLTTITLNGNDVLHLMESTSGITNELSFNQPLSVAPNPIKNAGILNFYNPKTENVHIGIYSAGGQLLAQESAMLPQGEYAYKLEGIGAGTYIIGVSTKSSKRSVVLISNVNSQAEPSIVYLNSDESKNFEAKSATSATKNIIEMQYNEGENLKLTAFLNSLTSIEELIPTSSQTVSFNFSAPTAAFSADNVLIAQGETVTFTDHSANNPMSWSWDFGDENTSTEANPSHTYTNAGTYTVELTVTNSYGSDTETKTNYITVESETPVGTVTDIDGNVYATIQIGTQRWMSENLKTTTYNDNSPIELVVTNTAWASNTAGAYCWFDNNESQYGETYGALYNWHAVNTGNLCPAGWHVSTNDDWTTLKNYVAANGHSGNEAVALRATSGWPNNGNGTDNFGFTALPGDMRFDNGNFSDYDFGYWWTATEYNDTDARFIGIYGNYATIYQSNYSKVSGYSVRCVRD